MTKGPPEGIPVDVIRHGDVTDAPAGSIIFAPYTWYKAEPLQWGIKIGDERDVLAITDWHGGHSKAGSVVNPRNDRPVFFVAQDEEISASLYLNANAALVEGPDTHTGAAGLLGFGASGLTLLSRIPDPQWSTHRAYPIDPRTWCAEKQSTDRPEAWTFDWHIVLSFGKNHQVRYSIERAAPLNPRPSSAPR